MVTHICLKETSNKQQENTVSIIKVALFKIGLTLILYRDCAHVPRISRDLLYCMHALFPCGQLLLNISNVPQTPGNFLNYIYVYSCIWKYHGVENLSSGLKLHSIY